MKRSLEEQDALDSFTPKDQRALEKLHGIRYAISTILPILKKALALDNAHKTVLNLLKENNFENLYPQIKKILNQLHEETPQPIYDLYYTIQSLKELKDDFPVNEIKNYVDKLKTLSDYAKALQTVENQMKTSQINLYRYQNEVSKQEQEIKKLKGQRNEVFFIRIFKDWYFGRTKKISQLQNDIGKAENKIAQEEISLKENRAWVNRFEGTIFELYYTIQGNAGLNNLIEKKQALIGQVQEHHKDLVRNQEKNQKTIREITKLIDEIEANLEPPDPNAGPHP